MNLLFLDFESYFNSKLKYRMGKNALDIVAYIRDPRFHAFGAAVKGVEGPTLWRSTRENCADPLDINALGQLFGRIDWTNTAVVSHNAKFDCFVLKEKYGILAGQYIDTLGMSRAMLGKTVKSHSLAALAEYFGLEQKGHLDTDGKRELTQAEENALAEYCRHDVDLCYQIYWKLAPEFPENQYPVLDQTIRMFVDPKLQLNVPLLEKTAIEEAKRRENIFTDIGIDKKEFASNVKFPALLLKRGFEVPTKSSPRQKDEKGEAVQIPALALGDTEFLEMLEGENEELRILCEARVAAKSTLLETRSTKLASIGKSGPWPFDVEFSGADQTHRFSGGSGAGGNPQNFTRGSALRQSVEAPEGFDLVVGDFANIELRIQAYLSRDPGLMGSIEQGSDIYCDFASAFFGRTITKENKEERRFGKTAILGLGYGMGFKKFIKTVRVQTGQKIDEDTARKAVELYRTRYAQIPALWQTLDNLIKYMIEEDPRIHLNLPIKLSRECFILPSGLKVRYPKLHQEEGERGHQEWIYEVWNKGQIEKRKLYGGKFLEGICQSLAGELCKDAMLAVGDQAKGQCHDEILVLCKRGLGITTTAKVKRLMSLSPAWLPQMKLAAEVKYGRNWLKAK